MSVEVIAYQSHLTEPFKMQSVPEDAGGDVFAMQARDMLADSSANSHRRASAGEYRDIPIVMFAHEQRMLKSEDVLLVDHSPPRPGSCHSLFMVLDGHGGVGAAQHMAQTLPLALERTLPQELPDWENAAEVADFSEKIRRGISSAVVLADNRWTATAQLAGTTMTLVVVSGWLVTVANTGDSSAVIDTGDHISEITVSHRIQINTAEQERLRKGGALLAPLGFHLQGPAKPKEMGVGPLRMWPGGLCVSRSIGDLDTGPLIVPLPHVRQMLVPEQRALRFLIASDGLWDLMTYEKSAKCIRNKLPAEAAEYLATLVVKDRRMADDMTVIVLDVTPQEGLHFPVSALRAGANKPPARAGGGGGLFACFKPPPPPPEPRGPTFGGPVTLFADVDCLEAYPMHTHNLARASMDVGGRPQGAARQPGDLTVHGNRAHMFNTDSSWTGNSGDSSHGSGAHGRHIESAHGGSIFGAPGTAGRAYTSAHGAGTYGGTMLRTSGSGPALSGGGAGHPEEESDWGEGSSALAPPPPPGAVPDIQRVYTLPPVDAAAAAAALGGSGGPLYATGAAAPIPGGGRPAQAPLSPRKGAAGPAPGARRGGLVRSQSAVLERDPTGVEAGMVRLQAQQGGSALRVERMSGSAPPDTEISMLVATNSIDDSTSAMRRSAESTGSGAPLPPAPAPPQRR